MGTTEECGNCGRQIGALEKTFLFKKHVICLACQRLLAEERSPNASPQTVAAIVAHAQSPRACPSCGSTRPAKRKPKGSTILLIFLLLFFILPGVLYLIFRSGYIYACPDCGYIYGDAS